MGRAARLFLASVSLYALASPSEAQRNSTLHPIAFALAAGPSIAVGSTRSTTGRGAALDLTFGPAAAHRISWTAGALLNFNNLPAPIVTAFNLPGGMVLFSSFVFDPMLKLLQTPRWRSYVTGGGGFGLKQVQVVDPNGNCDSGCVIDTRSSWQPVVNVVAGFAFDPRPGTGVQFLQETGYRHLFTPSGSYAGFETAGTTFVTVTLGMRIEFGRRTQTPP